MRSSMQGQGTWPIPSHLNQEIQNIVHELKKSEIDRLRSFLGSLDKKTDKGTCSLAIRGNTSFSYSLQASEIMH